MRKAGPFSRRQFIQVAGGVLGVAHAAISGAEPGKCFDPEDQDSAQSLRESLQYVNPSADPAQPCSRCAFFTGDASCGNCVIVHGKVDATGHCESWSPRAPAK